MKNIVLAIFFLFPALAFSAVPVAKLTIVEGHVFNHNAVPDSKTIIINIPDITGKPQNTVYFAQLDKNNNFKIIFKQYVAQEAQLLQEGISNHPLVWNFITHPGDKVHIDLDFKNITNIKFSGSAAKTNNALYQYISEGGRTYTISDKNRLYDIHDPEQYKTKVVALKAELLKNAADFEEKVQANQETKTWLENYITIGCYNLIVGAIAKSRADWGNTAGIVSISPKDVTKIYNPNLINADAYGLVRALMPTHSQDDVYAKYSPQFLAAINDTAKKYNNKLLVDLLKGAALCLTFSETNIADFNKNRDVFDSIQEPSLKLAIAKRYKLANYDDKVYQTGISAFAKQLKGTTAGTMIDSLIARHKNQVIYADVWATWCGPCRAEMPNSKKLAEKYKGKDVAFAYLCTRSPKDLWKTVSAELAVGGDHVYCDDELSTSLGKALKIHAIPFYVLINKNGEIVEAGNNLRPANYFTERKIKSLLE